MTRFLQTVLGVGLVACLLGSPAFAAGPVEGEVGAVWWMNEYEVSGTETPTSEDAASAGLRAELWLFNKYGMRAQRHGSDLEDSGAESTYTSVDVMWKAIAPTDSNYFAAGLGWQQMSLESIGLNGDTSGVRVSVEGRVGIGRMLYAYGQGAYLPSLDDVQSSNLESPNLTDLSAMEVELGVSWTMIPTVSLRAGYRATSTDFSMVSTLLSAPSSPVISGGGSGTADTLGLGSGTGQTKAAGDSLSGSAVAGGFFAGVSIRF